MSSAGHAAVARREAPRMSAVADAGAGDAMVRAPRTADAVDAARRASADPCRVRETLERVVQHDGGDWWLDDDARQRWRASWVDAEAARLAGPAVAEEHVADFANQVLAAIAAEDYAELAKHVPETGVCLRAAKGAACRWMRPHELARCATSGRRESWEVDSGDDAPTRLTCREAFRRIFYARDFVTEGRKTFNCFPEYARGNNAADVIRTDVPTDFYIEVYAPEIEPVARASEWRPWRALWLHVRYRDVRPELVGLTSEYWSI
jgi:hypothetical protein